MDNKLLKTKETNYGEKYKEHLFEQYKLYCESAEKISDRRQNANNYFITINTALSRAELPENRRKSFYLYVDEIHNFLTLSFADILSEARKYGLNLILAHQYIDQLDERIKSAIFGNVGTIISFRIGSEDARHLAKEFAPVFDEVDLVNLPNYHIYLKLMIEAVTSPPFSATTLAPPEKKCSYKKKIVMRSREKYARPRRDVEREILFEDIVEGQHCTTRQRLFFLKNQVK